MIKRQNIFLVLSFLIPTILFTNYVLNHIYVFGSSILDVGWFIHLSSVELTWPLINPLYIGVTESFFSTHFSPFFYVLSIIYKIFSWIISPHYLFSLFIGSMYGLISFSINMSFFKLINNYSFKILFFILILSILGSLNGANLALIGFPHIEIAIPALILLFITLYFNNYKKLSYLTFILLLTIREDAGFHFFGVIFIFFIVHKISQKDLSKIDKDLWIIFVISFIYSILAIFIQKTFFPGDNALGRIYLGEPFFSHITKEFIIGGIKYFIQNREYLYVPAIFSIIFAIYMRNIYLLIALLSIIPWSFLLFFAVTPMPNTFSNYYIFPYITMICWPILGFLICKYFNIRNFNIKQILFPYLFVSASSFFLYDGSGNVDAKPYTKFNFDYINSYSNIEKFKKEFIENRIVFGNILYDEPSACIFVKDLNKNEYAYLNNFNEKQKSEVDTIIFFKNSDTLNQSAISRIKDIIRKNKLINIFLVKNSNLIIATNKNSEIIDKDIYEKINFETFTSEIINARELPSQIGIIDGNNRKANSKIDKAGYLTFGPYIELLAGNYKFNILYESSQNNNIEVGFWDIAINQEVINQDKIYGTNSKEINLILQFTIPESSNKNIVEIRNYYNGTGDLTIKNLTITRVY